MSRQMRFSRFLTCAALMAVVAGASGCPAPREPQAPAAAQKRQPAERSQADRGAAGVPLSGDESQPPAASGAAPARPDAGSPDQPAEQHAERHAEQHAEAPAAGPPEQSAPPDHQPAGYGQKKRDPRQYEPLFKDWPRPQVALLLSGQQAGYIEPCGCAGLENQKGGLKRRHTFARSLSEQGWPLVALDLGGHIKRFGRQAEIKLQATVDSLSKIGYQAVGFGPQELRLPTEQLISIAANLADNPFVSANVGLLDFDAGFVRPSRIIEAGGRRIAVTTVLGKRFQAGVNNADVLMLPPEEALAKVLPGLKEQADFVVLMAHATPEESKELARQFPQIDLVVTAGGPDEPPNDFELIEGSDAKLVFIGTKGMHVVVVGLADDDEQPLRYQRVPLDDRFDDSPEMRAIFVQYQNELKAHGLAGLGLKPLAHTSGLKFVGSDTCADCHTKAHSIWSETGHAHATETLVNLTPQRQHDPECLSCHATGWDPQGYFPFESGFLGLEETPHLTSNGCENCHGPGATHAGVELGEIDVTDDQRLRLREQMRLPLEKAEAKCVECHDLDNSPDFKTKGFEYYWNQIEHRGKN